MALAAPADALRGANEPYTRLPPPAPSPFPSPSPPLPSPASSWDEALPVPSLPGCQEQGRRAGDSLAGLLLVVETMLESEWGKANASTAAAVLPAEPGGNRTCPPHVTNTLGANDCLDETARRILLAIFATLNALGIIANLILISYILIHRLYRNFVSSHFIAHLSLTNTIALLYLLPIFLWNFAHGEDLFSEWPALCRIHVARLSSASPLVGVVLGAGVPDVRDLVRDLLHDDVRGGGALADLRPHPLRPALRPPALRHLRPQLGHRRLPRPPLPHQHRHRPLRSPLPPLHLGIHHERVQVPRLHRPTRYPPYHFPSSLGC